MQARPIFDALALLRPYDVSLAKCRVGNDCDGGYVTFVDPGIAGPLYSFGITYAAKMSFEAELARAGRQVFIFDRVPPAPWQTHANMNFFQHGLAASNEPHNNAYALDHYLAELGHIARRDLLLKLDLEGGEWDLLPHLGEGPLSHFRQLIIELHWLSRLGDGAWRPKLASGLAQLNRWFTLGHVHANNNAPLTIVDGLVCPEVVELTYIRSDLCQRSSARTVFPTALDYPNRRDLPDHLLWFFPFLPVADGIEQGAFARSFDAAHRALPGAG